MITFGLQDGCQTGQTNPKRSTPPHAHASSQTLSLFLSLNHPVSTRFLYLQTVHSINRSVLFARSAHCQRPTPSPDNNILSKQDKDNYLNNNLNSYSDNRFNFYLDKDIWMFLSKHFVRSFQFFWFEMHKPTNILHNYFWEVLL